MEFTLQIQRVENVTIADLSGEFDIYSAPRFKEMLAAHVERGDRSFIVNLEGVSYLDSSGLAAVVMIYKRVEARGGVLRLVAPQPRTKRLLAISGVDRVIDIFSTRQEALDEALVTATGPSAPQPDAQNTPV